MERLESKLEEWRALPPVDLKLDLLVTDGAFQPRNADLVPFRQTAQAELASRHHIGALTLALEATSGATLEPLLVALIEGEHVIVDGHHRHRAYQAAGRTSAPCRVCQTTRRMAWLLSKQVNVGGARLPMHREQAMEACWQQVAAMTMMGAAPLPPGETYRSIGGRFGVTHTTVRRMILKLPEVTPTDFPAQHRDAESGVPFWRYVRQPRGFDMESLDMDQQRRVKAWRFLTKAAKLYASVDRQVIEDARLLARESDAHTATAELMTKVGDFLAEPTDDF
ncbi:ParB-like nuclease domain-containing protein [Stenotrophomonas maltophilia]|nr:ParB-like nuclease domain-containing protein [Stenotrophomonas maltophilia]